MDEYPITFIRKRGREERIVVMPNITKLLKWIEHNAPHCRAVRIQVVSKEGGT